MTNITQTNQVATVVEEGKENYWAGKVPCWEKAHCPEMIKAECPATKFQFLPCWQIEGTYCKLNDNGATGRDTTICEVCQTYKKYGNGEPIKIKLFGHGINASLREIEKAVQ